MHPVISGQWTPGINGLLLLEEQLPAVVKPHQTDLLEEKELKNKEIKSHKAAFSAVIRDIQSYPFLLSLFRPTAGFCSCALQETFAGK